MLTNVISPAACGSAHSIVRPLPPLSDRQERFVHEYLLDQNASAAALRAGYSPNSYRSQAAELMAQPAVRARVCTELGELFAELKLRAADLLRKRMRVALFDPGRLIDARGNFLELHELDEETRGALVVHTDVRANGERCVRIRQPQCNAALTALERRYAQFLDLVREDAPAAPAEAGADWAEDADGPLPPQAVVRLTPVRRRAEHEAPPQVPAWGDAAGAAGEAVTGSAAGAGGGECGRPGA